MTDHTKIVAYLADPRTDAERVKDLREQKRLSRRQLAELADLSPVAIRDIETGRTRMALESAKKIASALCVPLSEVTGN